MPLFSKIDPVHIQNEYGSLKDFKKSRKKEAKHKRKTEKTCNPT